MLNRSIAYTCLALALGVTACTAIYDQNATQCTSQKDCLDRGPDFAGTTCTAARVCEKIKVEEKACTTNQQCIDQNGGAGSTWTCRKSDNRCINLVSPSCQRVLADTTDLLDDNVVIIGATLPRDENGRQSEFAFELARQEIKGFGGLPPATPTGPRRPLAIVSCTGEHESIANGTNQFLHLADEVQTPFVAGPFTSQLAVLGATLLAGRNVLTVSSNASIQLTNLDDHDLVFRTQMSDDLAVQGATPFIKDYILPNAVSSGMLTAGEPLKVMVLATSDPPGQSITDSINRNLKFNDKNTVDNLQDGKFAIAQVGNPGDPIGHPYPEAERAKGVQQAIDFKPNLVIFPGTPIGVLNGTQILGGDTGFLALSRAWKVAYGDPPSVPLPYTMTVISGWAGTIVPLMAQLNAQGLPFGTAARQKYFGLRGRAYNFDPKVFGAFVLKIKSAQGFESLRNAQITPLVAMSYSRIYMFAYALAAIGNAPVKGPELSRGLRRVAGAGGGKTINAGPDDFSVALGELAAGRDISLVGPDGLYAFDEKGDRPGQIEVFCVSKQPKTLALAPVSPGYAWDPKTNTSKGPMQCVDATE